MRELSLFNLKKTRQSMRDEEKTEPDSLLQGAQGQEERQWTKAGANKFSQNTTGKFFLTTGTGCPKLLWHLSH